MASFFDSPTESSFKPIQYLESGPMIYPSGPQSDEKTSSRLQVNNLSFEPLSASQRRHAFGAFKKSKGDMGLSTSVESSSDTNSYGQGNLMDEVYGQTKDKRFQQGYQDPTHLTVPESSDFACAGSRGNPYVRHHSYDVPPPSPAPEDEVMRRRTFSSSVKGGYHSLDSSAYLYKEKSGYPEDERWKENLNPEMFCQKGQRESANEQSCQGDFFAIKDYFRLDN